MARLPVFIAVFLTLAIGVVPAGAGQDSAQSGKLKKRKAVEPKPREQVQEPPEEDEGMKEKEYTFNPLQATKELQTGAFYAKKGNYKAAVRRYREAIKWNPTYAEAYMRLGHAFEKLKDPKAAHEAFAKYLELAPDTKEAESIRKKLAAHKL